MTSRSRGEFLTLLTIAFFAVVAGVFSIGYDNFEFVSLPAAAWTSLIYAVLLCPLVALLYVMPFAGRWLAIGLCVFLVVFQFHERLKLFLFDADVPASGKLAFAVLLGLCLIILALIWRAPAKPGRREALYLSAAMALAPVAGMVLLSMNSRAATLSAVELREKRAAEFALPPFATTPDIFYVVPDRYPSGPTLREVYGHDNSGFEETLRARGFFVSEDSFAPHLKTVYSLSSVFSLSYLGAEEGWAPEDRNLDVVFAVLKNSFLFNLLRENGYSLTAVSSAPHIDDRFRVQVDQHYSGLDSLQAPIGSELAERYFRSFPLVEIAGSLGLTSDIKQQTGCQQLQAQFDFLHEATPSKGPSFYFLHVLVPHTPHMMNAKGECIEPQGPLRDAADWPAFKESFAGYVSYGNAEILRLFEHLKVSWGRPFLFLILPDEGPRPLHDWLADEETYAWQEVEESVIRHKYGITIAVYSSLDEDLGLYPGIGPINVWLAVLSALTGEALPPGPDRALVPRTVDAFSDVIDRADVFEKEN